MAQRTNTTEWRDRSLCQRLLISVLVIAGVVLWYAWLQPRSKYGALAGAAVAVTAFVAWTLREYRRGRKTREGSWENIITAVLFGGLCVFWCLDQQALVPGGALLAAFIGWGLVKRYRERWHREQAQQARREANRPAVRLVSQAPAAPGAAGRDASSRIFYAYNDGEGAAFDVVVAYATPHGRKSERLAGFLERHTCSEPVRSPAGCTEATLDYWGIPDERFEQHWRFDEKVGWLPSPRPTDGPRRVQSPV